MSVDLRSFTGEPGNDAYAAIRAVGCRRFLTANILSTIGSQMLYLCVGWEVYQATGSPTALGLVGFFQALPILLLAIPAGHLIDRFDRRWIVVIDQLLLGLISALMAMVPYVGMPDFAVLRAANGWLAGVARFFHEVHPHFDSPEIPVLLGLLLLIGMVRSINQPAKQALLPQLVPAGIFPNAASWHSSTVQASTMIGPALAGGMLGVLGTGRPWAFAAVYGTAAVLQWISVGYFAETHPKRESVHRAPLTLRSLAEGIAFTYQRKIILATMTMDLLCVLLGGATALLPLFSKDILACGPAGLGWLRAAPSLGAVTMAVASAHLPPARRAGRLLVCAVCCYGLATIGFGLSSNLVLSLVLLFLVGACDNISSVVRQTVVQMMTPDNLRGRVTAVKSVFTSASDGLGSLESGTTAALLGPRLAVVAGGLGALLVVPMITTMWPELLRFGSLGAANVGEDSAREVEEAEAALVGAAKGV